MNELDKSDYLLIVEQDRIVAVKKETWPEKPEMCSDWSSEYGCLHCDEKLVDYERQKREAIANGALVEDQDSKIIICDKLNAGVIGVNKELNLIGFNLKPGVYPIDRNLCIEISYWAKNKAHDAWEEIVEYGYYTMGKTHKTRKVASISQSQTPSVANDSILTTCNGVIDNNGRCLKCLQMSQTSSAICGRLVQQSESPVRSAEVILKSVMLEEQMDYLYFKDKVLEAMELYANQFRNGAS